jgi:hypothetical protein
MKYTKRLLFLVLLAIITFSTRASAGEVDLKVNGIGLGTQYNTVIKNLGKPLKTKKTRYNNSDEICGGIPYTELILTYPGVIVELWGDKDLRKFDVISIKFTAGSKWAVSGLKLGASQKEAIARFGKPYDNSKTQISYVNKDNNGFAGFNFKGGKLVSVDWESATC